MDDDEARWVKRDARAAETEHRYAVQRAAEREAHVMTVWRGLNRVVRVDGGMLRLLAEAAVKALEDDGIVFARMGSCEDERP